MRSKTIGAALAALLLACGVAACGEDEGSSGAAGGAGTTASADCTKPAEALERLSSGEVLSKDDDGQPAAPASDIELTAEELEKIRGMDAKAAIVMHFGGNDWTNAQIAGAKQQFAEMGIEVVAVTQADSKPEKQVSDIETVLAKKPDVILSIPTDPVATADAYSRAAEQGVQLVFMDFPAQGLEAGGDYVSTVTADNYGNGVVSAHLMARELGCEGTVGIIRYADAGFRSVQQRYEAFKSTIESEYPNIEIAADQDIGAPDFAGNAEEAASAMLTKNPDLGGIWTFFDVPAEGAKQAAKIAGRDDLVITTVDLGLNAAIDIASGGPIRGLGAQRPFDQGVTEAKLAGYGLLDKEAPSYVALPPLPVDEDNVLEAWTEVYHADPPAELAEAAKP